MKPIFSRVRVAVVVLCIAGGAAGAFSQVDSGRITGTVQDPSKAAIMGATVVVTNERTGEEHTYTTSADGSFLASPLQPSFYTIAVSKDGFASAKITGVQVTVGQEIHRDFMLQVATLSSTVVVSSGAEAAIDTTSARIGVNVTQREVDALPLNGRQVSQLFLQAPGSQNIGQGTFGEIRFSGRSFEQNAVRYDGIEGGGVISSQPGVLNDEINTPFRLQTSLENVQEFRIESNSYPAEYGTGTGGQVSIISKSGSNAFHGLAYEYFRNDHLDARNFFDFGTKKSELRLNQFGGSLGGPIVKDKLFFFSYYEGYRVRNAINNIEAVPHASTLAVTGQPVTGVNPTIIPLLPAFIGPGAVLLPGKSNDPAIDIYQLQGLQSINEDSGGLRLDYHLNPRHMLYARYFRDQGSWIYPEGVTGRNVYVIDNPQNGMLSLQSTLTNTVINEAKVGFNEALSRISGFAPKVNGADLLSTIAVSISGSVANTGIVGQGTTTGVATPGGLVRSNSASNGQAQPYTPYSISFIDNLSWLRGKHSFKFGGEVRMLRIYTDRIGGTTYSYSNLSNFLQNKTSSIQYLSQESGPSPYNNGATGIRLLKQQYYAGYAQDELKLRPNLTLNLGLRYEFYSPIHEDRNLYIYFNPTTGVLSSPDFCYSPIVSASVQGVCPQGPQPWYKADPAQIAPRVGLAWSPFASRTGLFSGERSVLHAGFGILHGPGQPEAVLQPGESDRVWTTLTSFPPSAFPSGGIYCGVDPSCSTSPSAITTFFLNNPDNRQAQVRAYYPDYTVGEHIYQYSASWQQQWGYQLVSTIGYVGSQGRNLFLRSISNRIVSVRMNTNNGAAIPVREFDIDCNGVTPVPNTPKASCPTTPNANTVLHPYAEIDTKGSGGYDSYNALQAQLVRRSNKGLTLSTQYTFAKSFGNSSGDKEVTTTGDPFNFDYDRGYNIWDVRHTFNLSGLYDLPFGHNKRYNLSGIANAVLGNWQLGTVVTARSGLPIDMRIVRPDIVFVDATGNIFSSAGSGRTAVINTPGGGSSRNVRRPDLLPGVPIFLPNGYLNPGAFAVPKPGTFGNLERGFIHGPHFTQADITVDKSFPLREALSVEFRAEFYNILNHPNFNNPPSTLNPTYNGIQPGQPFTSSSAGGGGVFGKFNSTVGQTVGTGTNRQIQFAMRVNF